MDVFVSGPSLLHVSVGGSAVEFSPANVGDPDWIPGQCFAMLNIAVGYWLRFTTGCFPSRFGRGLLCCILSLDGF